MKIVIQAGGLGTRMKNLVRLKPKGMIPAMYVPIIFHLFSKYKHDEFIIVGDYQFDVLDRYLQTFAVSTDYILLKSSKKGNVAGLKEAVTFIPEGEPFMVVWSDIILSEGFAVSEIKTGCQIGVVDFPCSWSLIDEKLVEKPSVGNGVAGVYIFDDKRWFADCPEEGSFTTWLANGATPLHPISLMGSIDVGTLEAHRQVSPETARSRPYNKIEFIDGKVVKTGITAEARLFIEREIDWYRRVQECGFKSVPRLIKEQPLTMELIKGPNLFHADLDDAGKTDAIDAMVAALKTLHLLDTEPASPWDIYTEYFTKTIKRLQSVAHAIPFALDRSIRINGVECVNPLRSPHRLREAVLKHLMTTKYGVIHGDCQFTNTLLSDSHEIRFIDPRGYFGRTSVLGDVRYDWAKMYYSINGNFDQFNIKRFELDITQDSVDFRIHSGGWEHLTDHFVASIPADEGSLKEISLIHAIVWLSLASHAWEDFDSMCLALYNGTLQFQQWCEDNSDAH